MPYRYYFDEAHIREWLRVSKTEQGASEYFQKYVFGVADFTEYLELIGGQRRLQELGRIEKLESAEGG